MTNLKRLIWVIPTPAGRHGWEIWLGPIGIDITWPLRVPAWSWGWWNDDRPTDPIPHLTDPTDPNWKHTADTIRSTPIRHTDNQANDTPT